MKDSLLEMDELNQDEVKTCLTDMCSMLNNLEVSNQFTISIRDMFTNLINVKKVLNGILIWFKGYLERKDVSKLEDFLFRILCKVTISL